MHPVGMHLKTNYKTKGIKYREDSYSRRGYFRGEITMCGNIPLLFSSPIELTMKDDNSFFNNLNSKP